MSSVANPQHMKKRTRKCTDAWTRLKLLFSKAVTEQVHPKSEEVKEVENEKDHGPMKVQFETFWGNFIVNSFRLAEICH